MEISFEWHQMVGSPIERDNRDRRLRVETLWDELSDVARDRADSGDAFREPRRKRMAEDRPFELPAA